MFFLKISEFIQAPIPKNNSTEASAIGSLRSTAPDLAAFLIELAKPQYWDWVSVFSTVIMEMPCGKTGSLSLIEAL